jgi:hypothetical protein
MSTFDVDLQRNVRRQKAETIFSSASIFERQCLLQIHGRLSRIEKGMI